MPVRRAERKADRANIVSRAELSKYNKGKMVWKIVQSATSSYRGRDDDPKTENFLSGLAAAAFHASSDWPPSLSDCPCLNWQYLLAGEEWDDICAPFMKSTKDGAFDLSS